MSWPDIAPSSQALALAGGVAAALVACMLRPLWPVARLVVTAVHELGHALTALAVGGKVSRVHLWLSTAGLTTYSLPVRTGRLRSGAVAVAGYPAPGLAGLAGVGLVVAGQARWWLLGAALLTLVMLVAWVRNPWGVVSTVLGTAAIGWVAWSGPPWLVGSVGAGLAVLLLVGGWRAAATHASGREHGGRAGSDAVVAARLLPAPAALWSGLFLLLATVTLLAGGWLLVTSTL
jgi:peptidase M50B-like protein